MNKNLTEIVFILDRSGSMSGLESDTIGGFNAMIEKQKKAPGEALVSTILFDNVSEVIHDRVNIRDIKPMTDREYCVHGCTALLDAIGVLQTKVNRKNEKSPAKFTRPKMGITKQAGEKSHRQPG